MLFVFPNLRPKYERYSSTKCSDNLELLCWKENILNRLSRMQSIDAPLRIESNAFRDGLLLITCRTIHIVGKAPDPASWSERCRNDSLSDLIPERPPPTQRILQACSNSTIRRCYSESS